MCSWFLAGLFAVAVLAGAARAADQDASLAEKDSAFFVAACQNSVNNLSAVEALAVEQKWTLVTREPEFTPVKIHAMWHVERDGRTHTVITGTDPKGITSCHIGFGRPNPSRDEFIASVGKFLRLKTDRDQKGSVLEAFRIENLSPADTTLIVETIDGHTIGAMIFGPLPETPRSPRPE
jgi:hypothetical protein